MEHVPVRRNTVAARGDADVPVRDGPARGRRRRRSRSCSSPGSRASSGSARRSSSPPARSRRFPPAGDGPARPHPGARRRLRRRHRRLPDDRARLRARLRLARHRSASRSSASRRGRSCSRAPPPPTCTRPSAARAGSRYVLFGAALRRRARPARLPAALRRQGARHRRARRAVARRRAGSWSSALVLVLLVRPDPRTIARSCTSTAGGVRAAQPAPLARDPPPPGRPDRARRRGRELRRSWSSVMNLTGYVVIDHGHHQADVFTVISLAHRRHVRARARRSAS